MNTHERRKPLVRAGDYCELAAYPFPGGFNYYTIEWYRLDTSLKLSGWIRHLAGKAWFSADMCRDLIDAVTAHFGWRLPPL